MIIEHPCINDSWESHDGTVQLYQADCLELLPHLPKVDAVVTDPPYGINTKSDGTGKISPWADLCNAAYWYAEWIKQCRKLLAAKSLHGYGSLWTFLNWRSMVTFQKASCDIAWPIESMLVWDKEWIGPGGMKGLRPSYELVALFCEGDWSVTDRGTPDIQRWKWSAIKPNGHPAEKPIDGLVWICERAAERGDAILDPFMGSGTTGVACVRTGRKFIGIEIEPKYYEIARKRIEAETRQLRMFQ